MKSKGRSTHKGKAKFSFGRVVATPNALAQIPEDEIVGAFLRHIRGDWGNLDSEDALANEEALEEGGSLYSQYRSKQGIKFWVITEADRSATTVLLPEDY